MDKECLVIFLGGYEHLAKVVTTLDAIKFSSTIKFGNDEYTLMPNGYGNTPRIFFYVHTELSEDSIREMKNMVKLSIDKKWFEIGGE